MSGLTCFRLDRVTLYLQDALEGMRALPDKSFDLAIVDPPYGASTNSTWKLERGHALPGFGGPWKLASHRWDDLRGIEGFEATLAWLGELKRLVKPTGSVWIHSTYHNSGVVNVACQVLGLEIINEVVWFKRNAFPNISRRRLTASHETILWVHTGGRERKYRFNYEDVRAYCCPEDGLKERGKQLRTVWDIPNNKSAEELKFGRHPTQKPLRLTERVLLVSAMRGGRLLVPFLGSGTEVIAGLRYGMDCVGFETDTEYFTLACRRVIEEIKRQQAAPQLEYTEC
ncbi:site-specific DNA-methyltransferase [Candidatus Bathyarchaeota archaeon]|nr:site-specific DNA-methyltransferase [Candidatus Bathyarchaeota archaeon]